MSEPYDFIDPERVSDGQEEQLPRVIEWPTAIDRPRGREKIANVANQVESGQPVVLQEGSDFTERMPCCFCNPPDAVEDRGEVKAELHMMTLDGEPVGSCCRMCVEQAPTVDYSAQQEPKRGCRTLFEFFQRLFR